METNQPKITKATRRCRDFSAYKTSVKDILSAAEIYQSLSTTITQKLLKLREVYNVSAYWHHWADGYHEARTDHWYRQCLVYCHVWKGKPINASWDTLPEEVREHIRSDKPIVSGHYWLNKDGTIGKPFFCTGEDNTTK